MEGERFLLWALLIDGKRRVLISGSIHYPRSTPEMWPDLIQKSKDGGLDVIETYVFWNVHEPVRNQYNFEGRYDLVKFVKLVAEAGLYVHLRIGPYVCAEWNYGGFPLWLHFIPGIKFRTDNEPFKVEMQRFTAKIVDMMKQEKLCISRRTHHFITAFGPAATIYINWAAKMAVSLDTGVPWVMCQQADAPDPIINTCNGFYCDQFIPNSKNKPKMWTENWSGWFLSFGGAIPYRPVEDLAFAVARFYQLGGTFQNYYMYHGGTNFGRTSGGPFISTSYDYDAPLDEYGLLRQPKWGHLKDLHKAIKLCEEALIATEPTTTSLGSNLEATVYKTGSGLCAAFLANIATSDKTINSVNVITSFTRQSLVGDVASSKALSFGWSWITEPVGISKKDAFVKSGLLEQINTTADKSDYLWYSLSTNIKGDEPFLEDGSGTGKSSAKVSVDIPIIVIPGKNTIDLLSLTVGLSNYGAFYDSIGAGITGPVKLVGQNGTTVDLSSQQWTYQTSFNAPGGDDPVAIDFTGMGKEDLTIQKVPEKLCKAFSDIVSAEESNEESLTNSLRSVGSNVNIFCRYHVPRSWVKSSDNTLVLFEEVGGDPRQIVFAAKQIGSLCSHVSESHPLPVDMWNTDSEAGKKSGPVLSLECPHPNQVISSIKFASFGTPHGTCGSFSHGQCSSSNALSIVQKACVGSKSCSIGVSINTLGDPCRGVKRV
ncbi:hypothetical protein GH714_014218 [Hevea brasiliensis]|uniref:beta-galactosidase n=1 Tax=Hevea brasiliensis TaxID=3981 RepID=A0A6A6LGL9_HEVBR|nr:hypothetical protein GH714_014218 [Hevea brasiliensis]